MVVICLYNRNPNFFFCYPLVVGICDLDTLTRDWAGFCFY